ncbi:DUF805 domain-containing protein [Roseobacter sp. OBYS 0001]|uniref:DUF805 domain-containing protein n=1 Tax=Roseobacter sp. OBYS 0001 TaxID=882651 RepID=UPI001C7FDDC5|nr:DUF805 domain-containing protein [Roseobacter sp. OBYS 0001]
MTLTESVKTCFRKYFTFSGRASRSEYWKFWLFWLLINVALVLVNSAIFGPVHEIGVGTWTAPDGTQTVEPFNNTIYTGGIFANVFSLAVLVPGVAVACRRLHDIGRSGWWQVMPFALIFVVTGAVIVMSVGWTAFLAGFNTPGGITVQNPSGAVFAILLILGSFAILLFWLCKKSQPGPNTYGPNPHEVSQ